MKSSTPYCGVTLPLLRRTCKALFAGTTFANRQEWRRRILELWRGARFREERYAAIMLTGAKCAAAFQIPQEMPVYEEIIVSGAWWDFVDEVATGRVGPILQAYPAPMKMLVWSRSDNLWKRRTSILCQLRFKQDTDLDLLYACIEPSLGSNEFFLRKAIGWALREYAWTDPVAVRKYVRGHKERLSGLSRREALKNI